MRKSVNAGAAILAVAVAAFIGTVIVIVQALVRLGARLRAPARR